MAKTIQLESGDDPLEMDFTETRPPLLKIALISLGLLSSGVCCLAVVLVIARGM